MQNRSGKSLKSTRRKSPPLIDARLSIQIDKNQINMKIKIVVIILSIMLVSHITFKLEPARAWELFLSLLKLVSLKF